jgi:hypothetical protein
VNGVQPLTHQRLPGRLHLTRRDLAEGGAGVADGGVTGGEPGYGLGQVPLVAGQGDRHRALLIGPLVSQNLIPF